MTTEDKEKKPFKNWWFEANNFTSYRLQCISHIFLPLVDPTAVLGEGIQLVVGDEIGLEVLLPVPDTLPNRVNIRVMR